MATQPFAFTAIVTDSGYTLGAAFENEPGYSPMIHPLSFATYDEALREAESRNERLGLSKIEASNIVLSSMRAQHERAGE